MQTVEGPDGDRYLLLKRASDSSLVRDPETGEERYLPTADLEAVDRSPLETAAARVPEDVQTLLSAVPTRQGLGLLLEIDRRGPIGVRALLEAYDLCESDVNGLLAEYRAAGLLEEVEVGGERGYDTTERASEAIERLER